MQVVLGTCCKKGFHEDMLQASRQVVLKHAAEKHVVMSASCNQAGIFENMLQKVR